MKTNLVNVSLLLFVPSCYHIPCSHDGILIVSIAASVVLSTDSTLLFLHLFHTKEVNINLLISTTAFFSYCPHRCLNLRRKMVLLRLFDSKPNAYKFKIYVFIFWNFIDKITFSFSTWIYFIINKFIILEIIPFIPTTRYFYAI